MDNNIFEIDYLNFLEDKLGKLGFRVPSKYPYPYATYDIIYWKDNKFLIPLYQNNLIISLDSNSNKLSLLPIKVNFCHSLFIDKDMLILSCYRKNTLEVFELINMNLINSIKLENEFPISAFIFNENLFYIDYINSKFIQRSYQKPSEKKDISDLIDFQKNPHSVKLNNKLVCVTLRDPSQIFVFENLNLIHKKKFPDEFDIISAYPLNKRYLILVFLNQGLYLYNTKDENSNLITNKIFRPTACIPFDRDLFVTSEEGSSIYKVLSWEYLLN
tara:strand:+ start:275 stop:1093 length:819 start_codon:yes stop_codon:yes gene_type:complete